MRTRLLLAAVCILILPFVFSPSTGNKLDNAAPYATVAIAGHVIGGIYYCDCNNPSSCTYGLSVRAGDSTTQDERVTQQNATQDNLITGFSAALLIMMLWLKTRA